MTIERKYVLVRLGKGDYMFAGNDGESVWRVRIYTDGPSSGLTDWSRDKDFWGAWRYTGRLNAEGDEVLMTGAEVEDWNLWDFHEGMCKTRGEAIQVALKASNA